MKEFVGEVGGDKSLDQAIGVASKVIDSMPIEWTDEKHRLYLNSMEASFVKQLYSSEQGSNDLLSWLSRTQVHAKGQPTGQLKVLHRGCWEKRRFEWDKSRAENETESNKLSGNCWIQHFRSHSTAKEPDLRSADLIDGNNLVGQSVHIINWRHRRDASSSKQTLPFFSREVHKVCVGSITEVSDQNFVDTDIERENELTRRHRKKRARNVSSQITDQVNVKLSSEPFVPFVVTTSEEEAASPNENDEQCRKKKLKNIEDSLETEPEPPAVKDQQAEMIQSLTSGDFSWNGDEVAKKHKHEMLTSNWKCEDGERKIRRCM